VVVFGCGAFGLLHLQAALGAGVRHVIAVDPVASRRQMA
jgi:L-iditol 2-dehydrogenase